MNREDAQPPRPAQVGIPPRPFLYTLDQISGMLEIDLTKLGRDYIYYDGKSVGRRPRNKMIARNIAPEGRRVEWRVAEKELIRWMRVKGFRFYQRDPWAIS